MYLLGMVFHPEHLSCEVADFEFFEVNEIDNRNTFG